MQFFPSTESVLAPWWKLSTRIFDLGNRLVAALTDPSTRERNARLVLLAYIAIWTVYAVIQKSSQDINFDMAEIVIWSRELAAGNPTHPPLASWIAALWFAIFPCRDWAYYLLGIVSATSALWITWIFSKRWLDPEKRVAGLALLALVPFFNFIAIKYNTNAALIPFWNLTAYSFLVSYSTRSPFFAALAGAGAAACMLAKYWAIFLLAGLSLAAIIDTRRSVYFRSPAPWITIAAGSLVIAPHVAWLFSHRFSTLAYPMGQHGGLTLAEVAHKVFSYVIDLPAFAAAPLLLIFLAARPGLAAIKDFFWPSDADRRLASLAFWLPITLPIPVVFLLHSDLTAVWAMSAMGLLPVVFLSSDKIALARNDVVRIVVIAVALPLVALVLAPGVAISYHLRGNGHHAGQFHLLAQAVEKKWHETTDQPLRLLGGAHALADTAAFYLRDRPSTLNIYLPSRTPWADEARIKREGIAVFCPSDVPGCMEKLEAFARAAPASRRSEFTLTDRYLGISGESVAYTFIAIAPGMLSTAPF
ncbi:MAG TPA: glycosyltransferase family 39 protein [Xanthobacteraceae bacterium]|nr:glycosyltransferase family 39 protein [Xanthobacteraceae bacterium]